MTLSPMLEAAAEYADRNLHVFPCKNKEPLTPHGFKDSSFSANQIVEWWTTWPQAQIALPTGAVNHLFVVDVDGPEGQAAIARIKLPATFTVETRPGRTQFWFEQPAGIETRNSTAVIAPQVDTRGDGGYVIAPPSIHHETGKPYRVVTDIPWAPVPVSIVEALNKAKNGASPQIDGQIPQGQRHQTLLSLAGSMRARHMSEAAILASLRAVNLQSCKPPLPDAELAKLAGFVGTKPAGFPGQRPQATSAEVVMKSFRATTAEKISWLWPNRIPIGKLTLLVGDPGIGKSLVTVDVAARISNANPFPDGAPCEVSDTVILSAEDNPNDTIRPRLDAAGANIDRVHHIEAVKVTLGDGSSAESCFSLTRDLEKFDHVIAQIPTLRLFVVDPVTSFLGAGVNAYRDTEVRQVLNPLLEIAARRRIAVMAVMHLRKGDADALYRISNSIAFIAMARCAWAVGLHPDDPEKRVMVPVKNSVSGLGSGLAFRIEATPEAAARVVWEDAVTVTADSVIGVTAQEKRSNAKRLDAAEEWLKEQLRDGALAEKEIRSRAEKAGHKRITIWRAKERLSIRSVKPSFGGGWFWELPQKQGAQE